MSLLPLLRSLLLLLLFVSPAMAGVNVNTATQSQLESLPGIGPSKARAIIEYREANGDFASLADLDRVSGIGPATLVNLEPHVVFSGDSTSAPQASTNPSGSVTFSFSVGGESSSSGGGVNINTASQEQLETLPGIGPSKATAIIHHRISNGPFSSCSGLTAVRGIGDSTVRNIGTACTVE